MTKESPRVLILSGVRWDYLWQRHHSLARAAADAGWQVDFVEPTPRSLGHVLGFFRKRSTRTLQRLDHGELPVGVRILGLRDLLVPLSRAPYDLGLIYTPDPLAVAILFSGRPRHITYDVVLDWGSVPRDWGRPFLWRQIERRLSALSRVNVTTDGSGIQAQLRERGVPSVIVPPAADPAFCDPGNQVAFAAKKDRALYFGSVHPEIDLELFAALVRAGIPVDVIGPKERDLEDVLRPKGENVHPPMSVEELAKVAAEYKVLLLPYRGGRATTVTPAKTWNCLAIGSWVLASGVGPLVDHPALAYVTPADVAGKARECFAKAPESAASPTPSWTDRWERMLDLAGVPRP